MGGGPSYVAFDIPVMSTHFFDEKQLSATVSHLAQREKNSHEDDHNILNSLNGYMFDDVPMARSSCAHAPFTPSMRKFDRPLSRSSLMD